MTFGFRAFIFFGLSMVKYATGPSLAAVMVSNDSISPLPLLIIGHGPAPLLRVVSGGSACAVTQVLAGPLLPATVCAISGASSASSCLAVSVR